MYFKRTLFLLVLFAGLSGVTLMSQEKTNLSEYSFEADTSICKYLKATDRTNWAITAEDSIEAFEEYFYPGYKKFLKVINIEKDIQRGRLKLADQLDNLINMLEDIEDLFETAIMLNPFGENFKNGIKGVYSKLLKRYNEKDDYEKQFKIINKILCYQTDQKSKISLRYQLGLIYYRFEAWEKAEEAFQLATDLIFEGDETNIDSLTLFYNLYYRGNAQLKQYKDHLSKVSLEYAGMIAPNEEWERQISNLIDFIEWDDGNIRASEKYQAARVLETEKKYTDAEKEYLELLRMMKTYRAKHEVQLRTSVLQFYRLDKKLEGLSRMWKMVKKFELDPETQLPMDSTKARYWNMYSRMAFSVGNDNYNTDRKKAFTYFYKISNIECPIRGKAYLTLASMSNSNADICLDYCLKAYSYIDQLSESDVKLLYNLFYETYSVKGEFDKALKWFKKSRNI